MKFTVVGTIAAAIELLREVSESTEHCLTACAVSGDLADAVAKSQIPLRLEATAEESLLAADVDVVVLAVDDPDDALRLARAASQADKHVVVILPSSCTPAFSFELHLILDESRCSVIPLTGRFGLTALPIDRHELDVNPLQIQQLALSLTPVPAPGADHALQDSAMPKLSRLRSVVEQGLDVLSASGLKYAQVTALDSLAPGGSLLSRLITLNSQPNAERSLPPATLTIHPSSGTEPVAAFLRLMLVDGTLQEFGIERSPKQLSRIVALCHSRDLCSKWMDSFSATQELADAADKSLRRRRTVDVHFDTGSERGLFKSQMTAMGCGVLTFMLFGMVAYLILAQLADLPDWLLHLGRILWITPLIVFLLAQVFLPLARDRSSGK